MRMTKEGDPSKKMDKESIDLICAVCGAEYRMKRIDWDMIVHWMIDCEHCGFKGTVGPASKMLNG